MVIHHYIVPNFLNKANLLQFYGLNYVFFIGLKCGNSILKVSSEKVQSFEWDVAALVIRSITQSKYQFIALNVLYKVHLLHFMIIMISSC